MHSPYGDFTVLLPIHNRPDIYDSFDDAITSIYNNTLLPAEVFVIVDGPVSPEFTAKLIRYQNVYSYKTFWLESNVGLAGALNLALQHVTTTWCFRADADDINMPTRFHEQYLLLQNGYDLVGSSILEINTDLKPLRIRRVPSSYSSIRRLLPFRNPFNHMTVAFRTSIVRDAGGYPHIYLREDYGLWACLIGAGATAFNSPSVLVHARTGPQHAARRTGFPYIRAEVSLQRHLFNQHISPLWLSFIVGFFRISCFMLPTHLHNLVYLHFLRSKK